MITSTISFLMATLVAAGLTPLVRHIAVRRNLLDATGPRKIHTRPIPRLGGIAIIGGFYVPLIVLLLSHAPLASLMMADRSRIVAVLAGGIIVGALGIYDDLRNVKPTTKLAVQLCVAVLLFVCGFRITQVASPTGGLLQLGMFAMPVTVLWIVGVINAVNLIDGLDGLAGGVALIGLAAVFVIAMLRGDPLLMFTTACLGGAVLGFLFYNFNPASIFMGDSGSMFVGLLLATSTIRASQKTSTTVAIIIPILLLALPLADTGFAIARRFLRRQSLFAGDREHIHHRLLRRGYSQRQTVTILYSLSVACGTLAVTMFRHELRFWFFGVALLAASVSAAVEWSRRVGQRRVTARTEVWPEIAKARQQLLEARVVDDVWPIVRGFAQAIAALRVEMAVVRWAGDERVTRSYLWQAGGVRQVTADGPLALVEPVGEHGGTVGLFCAESGEEETEQRRQALKLIAGHLAQVARREEEQSRTLSAEPRRRHDSLPGVSRI